MVNFDETSKIQVNLNSMQGQIGSDFKIPLFKKKKTSETGSSEGKYDQIVVVWTVARTVRPKVGELSGVWTLLVEGHIYAA